LGELTVDSAVALLGVAFGIGEDTAKEIIGTPKPPSAQEPEEARSRMCRRLKRLGFRIATTAQTRVGFFSPDAEWQRQIAREKKFVPAFLRAMRTIFRDQEKLVLKKLEDEADAPRARAIDPELLIDSEEWGRMFAVRVEPIRQKAFLDTAIATVEGLGGDESTFIFTDAMRKMLRKDGARLVKQVNATTGKRLAAAVTEAEAEIIALELEGGVVAGQATETIAKRIQSVFAVRRKEARTIARTEILKASQSAQLESYQVMDVEQKQWNTMRDSEVRDSHDYAEGQIVDVGESFDLGGEAADAPGIGAGGGGLSAGNSINCRCFLTPVVD
jgi:SPP1 gp7 family putative phage head morphogenesis protein